MPICIAGMHRSGTSMVARLLNLCGVYLGEQGDLVPASPENEEGHWEHKRFLELNDAVLGALGGGWDLPPAVDDGWEHAKRLAPLRARAAELIQTFDGREPWGWKDPRNSLTVPFWRALLPDLKVVICVRNPLEVHASLARRFSASLPFTLLLWNSYYERALVAAGDAAVVTHYAAYFHDAEGELRRVLRVAGLESLEPQIEEACGAAKSKLRHHRVAQADVLLQGLPRDTVVLDDRLGARAGPVAQLAFRAEAARMEQPFAEESERAREVNELRHEGQLSWIRGLEAKLEAAEGTARGLEREAAASRRELDRLRNELAGMNAELELLRNTRPVRYTRWFRWLRIWARGTRAPTDVTDAG